MSKESNLIVLAYHRQEKDRLLLWDEVERLVKRGEWMGTYTPSEGYETRPPAKESSGIVVELKRNR